MADARKKLRGVGDVRTALSTRVRSTPPQKATVHRDLYLRGTEKVRLENEIARLEGQQGRVQERLAETIRAIAKLQQEVQALETSPDPETGNRQAPARGSALQWKTMPLEY